MDLLINRQIHALWICPLIEQLMLLFQLADIKTVEDTEVIYMHYIPTIVQCMSSFAKEIPPFLDLTMDDQRLLIKGCILEAAVIHDSTHVHVDDQFWQDDKLMFRLDWQLGQELGLLGQVFHQFRPVLSKLRKLELTDAELSLLWALVLFCPGKLALCICGLWSSSVHVILPNVSVWSGSCELALSVCGPWTSFAQVSLLYVSVGSGLLLPR